MRRINELLFRLKAALTTRQMERDLDEEIQFHLDMEAEKLIERGWAEEEARRQAVRNFGALGRQKAWVRWSWGITLVQDLRADSQLALRQLRRNPGFAAAAILTLSLGIGANTAMFSIANQALLRRPPVREPERLAAVYTTCRRGFPKCSSSYPDYLDYRDRSTTFADLAAYSPVPLNVGDEATGARLATGLLVTGNYFGLLGMLPDLGRLIQPADNLKGAPAQVVVLSHDLWQGVFGSDPLILDRTVRLNGAPYRVIGVGPQGFRGLNLGLQPDMWIPMFSAPALGPAVGGASGEGVLEARGTRWIGTLIGRLAPGATLAQARSEMDAIAAALGEEYPEERAAIGGPRGITVDAAAHYLLPLGNEANLRRFVWVLLGVVGFSLLIAVANLANLLLGRATARVKESGIRLAVGAGRGRLIRQLLVESSVLALLGGATGLIVARGMISLLGAFDLPGGVAIGDLAVDLDSGVLLFAFVLSLLTALAFGLVPALQATRLDLVDSLKGGWSLGGKRVGHLRKGLVSVQVALCLVLLVGSGLFLRTLQNSLSFDLGFQPSRAAAARFNLSLLRYSEEEGLAFVDDLLRRVRALPDVRAASVATLVPFQAGGFLGIFAEIEGYEPAAGEEVRVDYVLVEPGYFEALGIPLLSGRVIGEHDVEGMPRVMVVNRYLAERYWPGRSAVGGVVRFSGSDVEFRVVGVVENPTWQAVGEEATPFVFLPLSQSPGSVARFLTLVAGTRRSPDPLLPQLRSAFQETDRGLSLMYLRTMDEQVGEALMPERLGSVLLTMFGALALVLASVGIYGVVSYSVRRQLRDLGIRIALGATPPTILRAVMSGVVAPILAGLVLGGAVAFLLTRTLESFMFGVSPHDPLTFTAISALLIVVALVAASVPASRAARLDPMRVLITE